MAVVELKSLTKLYEDSGIKAVDKANILIKDEEFVVLVGPSGCGKTTTLRMIAGLEEITDGVLAIGGKRMNEVAPKDRDIAMVFQNYALYPHMSVYDNMSFGLRIRRYGKSEIDKRVKEAAGILDISELLDRRPKALSGGQRQRVALGRAIVRQPEVFLFDEPLSNLDAKLRVQMRTEISSLHTRLQATMIYVTHDQIEAMTMGDRIVVIKFGLIQQIGTPLNLYNFPTNKFVAGFIGSPPMNMMNVTVKKEKGKVFVDEGNFQIVPKGRYAETLENYVGKEVSFGVRPEDFIYQEKPSAVNNVSSTIEVVEPLGSETHLYVTTPSQQQLIIQTEPNREYKVGSQVNFTVNLDKIHFYDNETERCILFERMNMITAKLTKSGDSLFADEGSFRMEITGEAKAALDKHAGNEIIMSIPPDEFTALDIAEGLPLPSTENNGPVIVDIKIESIETFGKEVHAHGSTKNNTFLVHTPPDFSLHAGASAKYYLDPRFIDYIDVQTGQPLYESTYTRDSKIEENREMDKDEILDEIANLKRKADQIDFILRQIQVLRKNDLITEKQAYDWTLSNKMDKNQFMLERQFFQNEYKRRTTISPWLLGAVGAAALIVLIPVLMILGVFDRKVDVDTAKYLSKMDGDNLLIGGALDHGEGTAPEPYTLKINEELDKLSAKTFNLNTKIPGTNMEQPHTVQAIISVDEGTKNNKPIPDTYMLAGTTLESREKENITSSVKKEVTRNGLFFAKYSRTGSLEWEFNFMTSKDRSSPIPTSIQLIQNTNNAFDAKINDLRQEQTMGFVAGGSVVVVKRSQNEVLIKKGMVLTINKNAKESDGSPAIIFGPIAVSTDPATGEETRDHYYETEITKVIESDIDRTYYVTGFTRREESSDTDVYIAEILRSAQPTEEENVIWEKVIELPGDQKGSYIYSDNGSIKVAATSIEPDGTNTVKLIDINDITKQRFVTTSEGDYKVTRKEQQKTINVPVYSYDEAGVRGVRIGTEEVTVTTGFVLERETEDYDTFEMAGPVKTLNFQKGFTPSYLTIIDRTANNMHRRLREESFSRNMAIVTAGAADGISTLTVFDLNGNIIQDKAFSDLDSSYPIQIEDTENNGLMVIGSTIASENIDEKDLMVIHINSFGEIVDTKVFHTVRIN